MSTFICFSSSAATEVGAAAGPRLAAAANASITGVWATSLPPPEACHASNCARHSGDDGSGVLEVALVELLDERRVGAEEVRGGFELLHDAGHGGLVGGDGARRG